MSTLSLSLLPGASADAAIRVLGDQLNGLSSVGMGSKYEVHTNYLRWATQAANALRRLIASDDVAHLILTQRHWVLCGVDPAANEALATLVNTEIEERRAALSEAITTLTSVRDRWGAHGGTILVPDTNVLVHHKLSLEDIDWSAIASDSRVRIVIPILIVDELDKRKRDRGATRTRARTTLRTLKEAFADPFRPAPLTPGTSTEDVSLHLQLDPPRHARLADNDRELIDRSVALSAEASRAVTLVTFDIGMTLRARAQGLKVVHPPEVDERDD